MKKMIAWLLVIWIAFVFIQSLFFKFAGSTETVIIFSTIAEWMSGIGLPEAVAEGFKNYGGYLVGTGELIAVALLLVPTTRWLGALLGLGVISGAIFFHLFTPLGINRIVDDTGATDGGALFFMACSVWVCCAILLWLHLSSKAKRYS